MNQVEYYEHLATTLGPRVLNYLVRRTDRREDAADLLADVFLVAWRKIDRVPTDPEIALPWLLAVARRALANHRRGIARRRALADRLRHHLVHTGPASPGPDALAIRSALARLDSDDRELLTLTAWDGLTSAQAAAVVGASPGAVRKRLERARGRLRRELRSEGLDDQFQNTATMTLATESPNTA